MQAKRYYLLSGVKIAEVDKHIPIANLLSKPIIGRSHPLQTHHTYTNVCCKPITHILMYVVMGRHSFPMFTFIVVSSDDGAILWFKMLLQVVKCWGQHYGLGGAGVLAGRSWVLNFCLGHSRDLNWSLPTPGVNIQACMWQNLHLLGNITHRASKRRRVLFAVVWSLTGQRGVVCYHI